MFQSINRFNVEIVNYSASSVSPISNPETILDYAGKDKFPIGDAVSISGIVRSDKSLSVSFLFGFESKIRQVNIGGVSGHSNYDSPQTVQFDATTSVTVPANNAPGGGILFGPLPCTGAEWVQVIVSGDTTSNFRLRVTKRIG